MQKYKYTNKLFYIYFGLDVLEFNYTTLFKVKIIIL